MKEMPDLICGKAAVGGNYNSTRDNIAELSAQVRAVAFYEKNGYFSLGDIHIDEGCPHVWMRKELK